MLDCAERAEWYKIYLNAALDHPQALRHVDRAWAWAWSMSMIAEQFCDLPDDEPVEELSR